MKLYFKTQVIMRFIMLKLLVALSTISVYGNTSIYGSANVDYCWALNKINLMLLYNFCYIFLLSTCYRQLKGIVTRLWSKVRLQNTGIYRIYNPQALGCAIASLRCHIPGPFGYKFSKSLCFEVYLLFISLFLQWCMEYTPT